MNVKTLGDAVIASVKGYVSRATDALSSRMDAFERRIDALAEGRIESMALLVDAAVAKAVAALPPARDGKDVDLDAVRAMVDDAVSRIPAPRDGKNADPEAVRQAVLEAVAEIPPASAIEPDYERIEQRVAELVAGAVEAVPKPHDGKSITLDDVRPVLGEAIARMRSDIDAVLKEPLSQAEAARDALLEQLGEMRQPQDGKSVTIDDVRPVIDEAIERIERNAAAATAKAEAATEQVQSAIASIRQPEDGKSVSVDDVLPDLMAEVSRRMDAIPVPKDGADGKDGRDGEDGKSITVDDVRPLVESKQYEWALDFERRAHDVLQRAVDRMPVPKDGRDAFELDDLEVDHDGDGLVTLRFVRGDLRREFALRLPVFVDRGVFKSAEHYERGNGVTWGGSYWIAQNDAPGKPGDGEGWRLAVKRGRDGKDGEPGIPGKPGRDLTKT